MKPSSTILCGVIALLAVLLLLTTLIGRAYAQPAITPDTACGAFATGKRPADEALYSGAVPNQRVGQDGYWRACEAPPGPAPGDCEAAGRATWAQGAHKCIGDQERPPLRNGARAFSFQEQTPGTVGYLFERCADGKRTTVASACHNRCVEPTTITAGRCHYEYKPKGEADALSGGQSLAVGQGRCAARIVCNAGTVELVGR